VRRRGEGEGEGGGREERKVKTGRGIESIAYESLARARNGRWRVFGEVRDCRLEDHDQGEASGGGKVGRWGGGVSA